MTCSLELTLCICRFYFLVLHKNCSSGRHAALFPLGYQDWVPALFGFPGQEMQWLATAFDTGEKVQTNWQPATSHTSKMYLLQKK